MRKNNQTIESLLKKDGAVLIRNKKHQIWKLSNNKTLVISNSSSDINYQKQNIRLFHKLMNSEKII